MNSALERTKPSFPQQTREANIANFLAGGAKASFKNQLPSSADSFRRQMDSPGEPIASASSVAGRGD
jgi:hypothetical protein